MVLEAANAKAKEIFELSGIAEGLGKGSSGEASGSFCRFSTEETCGAASRQAFIRDAGGTRPYTGGPMRNTENSAPPPLAH